MADQPDIAAATEPKNRFQTITLEHPITRGETKIEKINLRKPKTGELRGMNMPDIINMNNDVMMKIIPRISDPVLIDDEVVGLEPEDFAQIVGAIRGFFYTKAEMAALEQFFEQQRLKT